MKVSELPNWSKSSTFKVGFWKKIHAMPVEPEGLLSPFFNFLRVINFRLFRFSFAPQLSAPGSPRTEKPVLTMVRCL